MATPKAPVPAPPPDAAQSLAKAEARNIELAEEIAARLAELQQRPVTEHAEEYQELHGMLTERLSETDR